MVNLSKKAVAAAAGISEGDYTTWTHKWTNTLPDGIDDYDMGLFIDERSNVIVIGWPSGSPHPNSDYRWGIFNITDFSPVFLSPTGSRYTVGYPFFGFDSGRFERGFSWLANWSISVSLQSYTLLLRYDEDTIEVWRGGGAKLWSHNTADEVAGTSVYAGGISLTGKYICIWTESRHLILYEGS